VTSKISRAGEFTNEQRFPWQLARGTGVQRAELEPMASRHLANLAQARMLEDKLLESQIRPGVGTQAGKEAFDEALEGLSKTRQVRTRPRLPGHCRNLPGRRALALRVRIGR